MADDVMAQMGFGVSGAGAEDRMRGIAKQLRGDRSLGTLFAFSGSADVRRAGQGMIDTAQQGIKQIGDRRAQGLTRAAQQARDTEAKRRNKYAESRNTAQDALKAGKYETAQGRLDAQTKLAAGKYETEQDRKDAQIALASGKYETEQDRKDAGLALASGKYDTAQGRLDETDSLAAEALEYERTQAAFDTAEEMQLREDTERAKAQDERAKLKADDLAFKRKKELQVLKDAQALERAQVKAKGDLESSGRMGATEQRKFREATTAVNMLPDIMAMVEATPSAFGAGKDLVTYLPDWTPNMATEGIKNVQNAALSDDEQQARSAVFNQAYQLINSLAGAALSKHEKDRIERFTPTANDSARTVKNKLRDMQRFVREKHKGFSGYADYIELAPLAEQAKSEQPAPADAEARKVELRAQIAALKAAQGGGNVVTTPLAPSEVLQRTMVPPGLPKTRRMSRSGAVN